MKTIIASDEDSYLIRILEDNQKKTDEVGENDKGQILNYGNKTISPIMTLFALIKFSPYWGKDFSISDEQMNQMINECKQLEE